jgi:glycosyltransferase involved in cell wall biosynthesis
MKIAFLVASIDGPSTRFRVFQYLPYFAKEEEWDIKVYVLPDSLQEKIQVFFSLKSFDIVFLQKSLLSFFNYQLLRKNSKLLVFDFDDAIMFHDSRKEKIESFIRRHRFARIIKNSDIIIAGNDYLKNHAMKYNRNVFVVPTPIDMERYKQETQLKSDITVTLGWIGSSSTIFYLELFKHVWDRIFIIYPNTRLKIVADKFFDCDKIPVIKKKWNYEDEIDDLHSFDIGLMPLTDDLWSGGKCGLKLLQYMAAGVPVICSPVGVNKEIVRHGVNGFWATNENEWLENLGKLIKNLSLREKIGKEAIRTVKQSYSLEVWAPKLQKILKKNVFG